ncbi:MAG: ATP-binding protein [bacterium]|nr:ATP-binding protein [bacterium]
MFGIFSKKQDAANRHKLSAWGDGQAVLSAIDDGVVALDPSGNVQIMNPAAEKIVGWNSGDAVGLSFESIFQLANKEEKLFENGENPIRKALNDFESFESRELFIKTQSGKLIPIFLSINSIDERHSGLVVVFRNIAKEVKENREQTEFISTASHEMRTPVASIEGYLGLALNPATATIDSRARQYLEKAHQNTQHLGQLFQDLLDITKAEDGRLKNEPVVLDAVEFARNIWEGLKTKAEAKNLDYVFALDEKKSGEKLLSPVYFIHVDSYHLHEVLDNLFENAIKYTLSGKVSVNVTGDNQNVQIIVQDSGIGIPSEDIPHLFQKFYRVDNSETREIGGTGLGLYLSRRLVEAMNGKISVESEYQKGSKFIVQLPRLTREQAEKLKQEEKPSGRKKPKILPEIAEIKENIIKGEQLKSEEAEEVTQEVEPKVQSEVQVANPQPQPAPTPQVQVPAQYAAQEQAIRNYQMQQYYAAQKRAQQSQPQTTAPEAQSVPVGQANPYFPASNVQPVAPPQNPAPNPRFGGVEGYRTVPPAPPRDNQAAPSIAEIEKMREEYLENLRKGRTS